MKINRRKEQAYAISNRLRAANALKSSLGIKRVNKKKT